MKTKVICAGMVAVLLAFTLFMVGCTKPQQAQSVSGVKTAAVGKLEVDQHSHTIEQRNIIDRIKSDNELGAVKHLYVISAYSGQVILYSPVRGKVTSGGKSLTPRNILSSDGSASNTGLPMIGVGDRSYYVNQLPNEDGTYGSGSADYIYWFTPEGNSHQHFLSGGQIVHISDKPVTTKGVVINIEK